MSTPLDLPAKTVLRKKGGTKRLASTVCPVSHHKGLRHLLYASFINGKTTNGRSLSHGGVVEGVAAFPVRFN
ncbi:hypothetical protein J6590_048888 [Homalodisca vitripennis]|nr:hypothetical protein J6590_048888 [Homalodisca vitripennis]